MVYARLAWGVTLSDTTSPRCVSHLPKCERTTLTCVASQGHTASRLTVWEARPVNRTPGSSKGKDSATANCCQRRCACARPEDAGGALPVTSSPIAGLTEEHRRERSPSPAAPSQQTRWGLPSSRPPCGCTYEASSDGAPSGSGSGETPPCIPRCASSCAACPCWRSPTPPALPP